MTGWLHGKKSAKMSMIIICQKKGLQLHKISVKKPKQKKEKANVSVYQTIFSACFLFLFGYATLVLFTCYTCFSAHHDVSLHRYCCSVQSLCLLLLHGFFLCVCVDCGMRVSLIQVLFLNQCTQSGTVWVQCQPFAAFVLICKKRCKQRSCRLVWRIRMWKVTQDS